MYPVTHIKRRIYDIRFEIVLWRSYIRCFIKAGQRIKSSIGALAYARFKAPTAKKLNPFLNAQIMNFSRLSKTSYSRRLYVNKLTRFFPNCFFTRFYI